jgi:hypothetical protein
MEMSGQKIWIRKTDLDLSNRRYLPGHGQLERSRSGTQAGFANFTFQFISFSDLLGAEHKLEARNVFIGNDNIYRRSADS